jgi:hypothetical protein
LKKSAFLFILLLMYKPYKTPVITASPDVKVPRPRISKFAVFLGWLLGKAYLFLFFGVSKVTLQGDSLVYAFNRALSGNSRCIIAFRHPNAAEPQILTWFFLFKLRRIAARMGVRFERGPHALFVYGYEVARWGGRLARYIMPNLAAMPIHHSKMDRSGMERIYRAITEGPYPLALAPEGQVSYTADSVPRLEPGTIRVGFHAAEQLDRTKAETGKNIPVEILPLSIHYRFGAGGKAAMTRLLARIEKLCGFSRAALKEAKKLSFHERARRCREHILEVNESRYNFTNDGSLSFEERLEKVINTAIETAERMLGLKKEGDLFARMYKVRQVCWDKIFLPDVDNMKTLSRVKRSALDLAAGEAWYISRHQELVDFCWYFRRPVPDDETALHGKIEYIQNLWDFANRTMGGAISERKNIPVKNVIIKTAPAINLTERLPQYYENKKDAVERGLSDLEKAFLECIDA